MFAEDVERLPKGAFHGLLQQHRQDPATLQQMRRCLGADMDGGSFSAALVKPVLRFNGKLFKGASAAGYSLLLTPHLGERVRFEGSRLVQDAVLRNLQTLAESSQRLSTGIKSSAPQIPWRELAVFRNVIVHGLPGRGPRSRLLDR